MFSGIVSNKVRVVDAKLKDNSLEIKIEKPKKIILTKGESVSLNGICSTVINISKKDFSVFYMTETLSKTKARGIKKEEILNFEESLRVGDKNSGHFVYGHIDCVGKILKITSDRSSKVFLVEIPKEFRKYTVYKGSVAIDGVSLTISKITKTGFEVSLIPHTLMETNLDGLKAGDKVNIETDIIAKYAKGYTK